ncbi:MAG: hypothetical protein U0840_28575 [Gemmataceae bacterium]
MNEKAQSLGRLLESLGRVVTSLSDDQVDALLRGEFRLEVSGKIVASKPSRRPARAHKKESADSLEAIEKLRQMQTPEEGHRYLREHVNGKESLRALARALSLPIGRSDDGEQIERKIVIQTITSRINREAIRGTPSRVQSITGGVAEARVLTVQDERAEQPGRAGSTDGANGSPQPADEPATQKGE